MDDAGPAAKRRWPWFGVGLAGLVVLLGIGAFAVLSRQAARPIPPFPSLTAHPDPSLHGTVAYTAPDGCVRIVSASGARSRDVYCLPAEDLTKAPERGKEVGPQLVWLPDGRLEITMFRMDVDAMSNTKEAPPLVGAWQKIVDVRSGRVDDVPAAEVPDRLDTTSRPTTSPDGRTIITRSDPRSGTASVVLKASGSERTLLSARGPGKYTYGLEAAFWAPDWQWVAADDGRILVITTDATPETRVLVTERGGRSGGAEGATFAVTADDLLAEG